MRRDDLDRFYSLMKEASQRQGGPRTLADSWRASDWPSHGVYFFFEAGEFREDGTTPRVTRVGTHAISETSRTTLWDRLRAHKGTVGGSLPSGGNHRSSIFRLHLGAALLARDGLWKAAPTTWGKRSSASADIRRAEHELELVVSAYVRAMPFLWIAVPGPGGLGNTRSSLERNSIALLSNFGRAPIDTPSPAWLGHHSERETVRQSGLWNVQHVDKTHDRTYLDSFQLLISSTRT